MRDRTADLFRAREALSQLSYSPVIFPREDQIVLDQDAVARRIACHASAAATKSKGDMVGLGRFELPTSPLSGVRSNQLSYRPVVSCQSGNVARCQLQSSSRKPAP